MPPTAKYYLSVSLSSKGVPDKSSLAQGTDVCTYTNTQWVFHFAVSCHCRCERLPSSPSLSTHPLMAVAGLKRRGRTGDVETDGCWHQPKTRVWQKWAQRETERDYPIWAWFCSTSQQQNTDSENENKVSCRLNTCYCSALFWSDLQFWLHSKYSNYVS